MDGRFSRHYSRSIATSPIDGHVLTLRADLPRIQWSLHAVVFLQKKHRVRKRVCQAGNTEWLLAVFLLDAAVGHLGQAQQLFPFGLLAAAGHRAIQMRLGSEIGTDQIYGGSEQATARSDAALEI